MVAILFAILFSGRDLTAMIEMWSMIFAGTTCSPCHVDPSSGLHSHFAFFNLKKNCSYFRIPQSRRPVKGVSSSKFVSGFDSMANLLH